MGKTEIGHMEDDKTGLSGDRVWLSIAQTINLGNYESLRIEYGEGQVVGNKQTFKEVQECVSKRVTNYLEKLLEAYKAQI